MACASDEEGTEVPEVKPENEMVFDKEKWVTKKGKDYPYRDRMLDDVVYNDTIRTLNKGQVIELLGEPDYKKEGHLYYRITESRLGSWTMKTKTMVIKLRENDSIEWIKIKE